MSSNDAHVNDSLTPTTTTTSTASLTTTVPAAAVAVAATPAKPASHPSTSFANSTSLPPITPLKTMSTNSLLMPSPFQRVVPFTSTWSRMSLMTPTSTSTMSRITTPNGFRKLTMDRTMTLSHHETRDVLADTMTFVTVKEWWSQIMSTSFENDEAFMTAVRDGAQLCTLINTLRPGTIPKISDATDSAIPFLRQFENIRTFVSACQTLGVAEQQCFSWAQLEKPEHQHTVMTTLAALKSVTTDRDAAAAAQSVKVDQDGFVIADDKNADIETQPAPAPAPVAETAVTTPAKKSSAPSSRTATPVQATPIHETITIEPPATPATSSNADVPFSPAPTIPTYHPSPSPAKASPNLTEDATSASTSTSTLTVTVPETTTMNTSEASTSPDWIQKCANLTQQANALEKEIISNTESQIDAAIDLITTPTSSSSTSKVDPTTAPAPRHLTAKYVMKKALIDPIRILTQRVRSMCHDFNGMVKDVITDVQQTSEKIVVETKKHVIAHRDLQSKYIHEQLQRKELLNKLIELQGNIRVFARIRPLATGEIGEVMKVGEEHTLNVGNAASGGVKSFQFDRVFDMQSTQEQVFADVAPFIQSCIDGYNVCIFAYGQTGSGKTFTMEGSPSARGVNYRALEMLFTTLADRTDAYESTVSISCVEIYNEQPRDLLVEKEVYKQNNKLDLRQNASGGVYIPDLTEITVTSVEQVNDLMINVAACNRQVSATTMNVHSSRSHCLLFINVTSRNRISDEKTYGKLVLIDLAGSERVKKSEATGMTLKEAQHINKSLAALGDVMSSLRGSAKHIPFRNSKLTYLLQECLSGNSKCLMFCNVSPCESSLSESICSLQFASRVRNVQLGQAKKKTPSQEVDKIKNTVTKVKEDMARLVNDHDAIKQTLKESENDVKNKNAELVKLQQQLRQQQKELNTAKEEAIALQQSLRHKEKEMELLKLELETTKRKKLTVDASATVTSTAPTIVTPTGVAKVNVSAPAVVAVPAQAAAASTTVTTTSATTKAAVVAAAPVVPSAPKAAAAAAITSAPIPAAATISTAKAMPSATPVLTKPASVTHAPTSPSPAAHFPSFSSGSSHTVISAFASTTPKASASAAASHAAAMLVGTPSSKSRTATTTTASASATPLTTPTVAPASTTIDPELLLRGMKLEAEFDREVGWVETDIRENDVDVDTTSHAGKKRKDSPTDNKQDGSKKSRTGAAVDVKKEVPVTFKPIQSMLNNTPSVTPATTATATAATTASTATATATAKPFRSVHIKLHPHTPVRPRANQENMIPEMEPFSPDEEQTEDVPGKKKVRFGGTQTHTIPNENNGVPVSAATIHPLQPSMSATRTENMANMANFAVGTATATTAATLTDAIRKMKPATVVATAATGTKKQTGLGKAVRLMKPNGTTAPKKWNAY